MAKRVEYDHDNAKTWTCLDRIDEMGKSRVLIECPFCKEEFWAYIWSISGGGKKCTGCGAKHNGWGYAHPVKGGK